MKDFIYNLYSSDNFTLYLTIALVVLIILFFIVLFFGKKDKKLQETQKLQKVADGFKEEKTEQKVEVTAEKKDDTVLVKPMDEPAFDDLSEIATQTTPVEAVSEKTMVAPTVESEEKLEEVVKEEDVITEPANVEVTTMEPEGEMKEDVNIPELHFDELSASLEKELTDLENIKNEFQNITLPEIEKQEEPKEEVKKEPEVNRNNNPQIFSSVFVNPKAPEENTAEFELPTLKKTEVKEENQTENNFDLADIKGETYDLNEK